MEWPESLVDSLARRRCVVVVGSGISRNSQNDDGSRPPTWEGFLHGLTGRFDGNGLIGQLLGKRDYLTACEILKSRMGRDEFIDSVQREFQRPGFKPAEIHQLIYDLDASIVATPNFDNIYENYALQASHGSVVIKNHTSDDIANYLHGGDVRLILKTHGSANDPEHLIFTRQEYAEARTKHILFYEILKSLALTHVFLFLGCGTDDPDIRMLFEDIQFAHGRMPFHYMTLPAGEVDLEILQIAERTMRVRFLEYSGGDNHKELTESLRALVQNVETLRAAKFSTSLKW